MSNFIRWNSTTKLYEISTDLGSSWATLDIDAAQITAGLLNASRVPSLDASKIATGTFDAARIPAILNAMVDAAAAIAWTKISKSGSSIADLGTRSASDINAGTLAASLYADFVASGASHAKGAVPDPGASAGTTKFLREDASWQVPSSSIGCVLHNSANISISNSGNTTLTWDTEDLDSDTMHDTGTNPSRLIFKTAGTYIVGYKLYFAAVSGYYFNAYTALNGDTTNYIHRALLDQSAAASASIAIDTSFIRQFALNDYIEVVCTQNYSSARNVLHQSHYSPYFYAYRLGA
jgi:hypothetical protein